jgi:plasmid maintenance system killer protein
VDILFGTAQLGERCNDSKRLRRDYGSDGEKIIRRRLDELRAAATLAVVGKLPGPRCEELKGDRAGQLSVRLHGGFRLLFEPVVDPAPRKGDGGLDWAAVTAVRILAIEDYHA